jgi:hypothetical protein
MEVELLVVLGYERVLATGTLTPSSAQLAGEFLGHERRHVAALSAELARIGAAVPAAPADVDAADRQLSVRHFSDSLRDLHSQHACLKLLIDLESLAEGAYYAALQHLVDPTSIRTCLEIMGCEAQHWTMLSNVQHPGRIALSVPYAFVQGDHGGGPI